MKTARHSDAYKPPQMTSGGFNGYQVALNANFQRRPNEQMFLWHAVLLLARAPKSGIVGHAGIAVTRGPRQAKQIPDFAIDNHAGGKMNWTESLKLENCTLTDEYEKEARTICEEGQD